MPSDLDKDFVEPLATWEARARRDRLLAERGGMMYVDDYRAEVRFADGSVRTFQSLEAEGFRVGTLRDGIPPGAKPSEPSFEPYHLPDRHLGYRTNVRPEARLARRATRWKRFKWSLRIGPVRLWWRGTKRWWRRRARAAPVQLSAADRAQGEIERRAALRTYEKHRQAHDAAVRAWRDEVTCWRVLPCATCGATTGPCDAGLHS